MRFLRNLILGLADKVMPVSPLVEAIAFELANNIHSVSLAAPEFPAGPYLMVFRPGQGLMFSPFLSQQGIAVHFLLPGWDMHIETYYFDDIDLNFRERRLLAEAILEWADCARYDWKF